MQIVAKYLPRAVGIGIGSDDTDTINDAKFKMMIAASSAGTGFGNSGVHLCHGMSYPISSQVKPTYINEAGYLGLDDDHPLIPHGLSVIVSAPAVFKWTAVSNLERHATCAKILQQARIERSNNSDAATGKSGLKTDYEDVGAWISDEILMFCDLLQVPMGISKLGYSDDDIPSLAQGTLPQHRVTKLSPRQPVDMAVLETLFQNAMEY